MSREAARRTQCANNLRQIALAFQNHEASLGHLPSSGWGWQWVGHPQLGYGKSQPGGWAYNILPFLELGTVHDLGAGAQDGSDEFKQAIYAANSNPLSVFVCPSRRLARPWPMIQTGFAAPNVGFSPLLPDVCLSGDGSRCKVSRSDYAVNSGNINEGNDPGPSTILGAKQWKWRYDGAKAESQNGISFQRSEVRYAQITDGSGTTLCIGERYLPQRFYKTGEWTNDDLSLFAGHDGDTNVYTGARWNKSNGYVRPVGSDSSPDIGQHYGSAHPGSFNAAMCDGSVHAVSYDIDPQLHRLTGGRNDAERSE
jgi:prepilin-type processing-associated H-X9-DG protein